MLKGTARLCIVTGSTQPLRQGPLSWLRVQGSSQGQVWTPQDWQGAHRRMARGLEPGSQAISDFRVSQEMVSPVAKDQPASINAYMRLRWA